MTDTELADALIARLNEVITDPEVRADVHRLVETRVPCGHVTADHPSIQVQINGEDPTFGFIGLLNGIVGAMPGGVRAGWGYIAAVFDDQGQLLRFERTN